MRVKNLVAASALVAAVPLVTWAQTPRVEVNPVECLPVKHHAVVTANVSGILAGTSVRLYFRRLHEVVEDFYYVEMNPRTTAPWWAVVPSPTDDELEGEKLEGAADNPEAQWWVAKEKSEDRDPNDDLNTEIIEERAQQGMKVRRDWMLSMNIDQLEDWLTHQKYEPAEIYAAVVDAGGNELAHSKMMVVPVTDDCEVDLNEEQRGQANNLVVGETAPWEAGKNVFHWLCDGIVTRRDIRGVLREDDICRSCVFALAPTLIAPASAAVAGIIIDRSPEPISPVRP